MTLPRIVLLPSKSRSSPNFLLEPTLPGTPPDSPATGAQLYRNALPATLSLWLPPGFRAADFISSFAFLKSRNSTYYVAPQAFNYFTLRGPSAQIPPLFANGPEKNRANSPPGAILGEILPPRFSSSPQSMALPSLSCRVYNVWPLLL